MLKNKEQMMVLRSGPGIVNSSRMNYGKRIRDLTLVYAALKVLDLERFLQLTNHKGNTYSSRAINMAISINFGNSFQYRIKGLSFKTKQLNGSLILLVQSKENMVW